MNLVDNSETICKRCGRVIVLMAMVRGGKYILAHPSLIKRKEWKCQPTEQFPVRSHVPVRYADGTECKETV